MYSYRIEQAIKAATILHKGQVRKGEIPIPYVSHLFAVMLIASDYTDKEEVLIACLLHDALEDTDYTSTELQEDFGGYVREIVEGVTEPNDSDTKQYSWVERKAAYLKRLKNSNDDSLIVAAADKIHNMRSIIEEYYDDHNRFMSEFGSNIDERLEMYQGIHDVLNRRLDNAILGEFEHVFTEYKHFIEDVKATKEKHEEL